MWLRPHTLWLFFSFATVLVENVNTNFFHLSAGYCLTKSLILTHNPVRYECWFYIINFTAYGPALQFSRELVIDFFPRTKLYPRRSHSLLAARWLKIMSHLPSFYENLIHASESGKASRNVKSAVNSYFHMSWLFSVYFHFARCENREIFTIFAFRIAKLIKT